MGLTQSIINADTLLQRANFLVTSSKESGAWLNGLPISSLVLYMYDATVRISMGLRCHFENLYGTLSGTTHNDMLIGWSDRYSVFAFHCN